MEIKSWKDNLLSYINKIDIISEPNLIDSIQKDKILLDCIANFFNTENIQDIIILYREPIKIFKSLLKNRNVICVPNLEGNPRNIIKWEEQENLLPSDNIQISYLILDDTIDPLYELKLICGEYNLDYNIRNLNIKCLVDNRTPEYKNQQPQSIESRSGLSIKNIITLQ